MISVLLPTMRIGGLDIVFSGLAKQTFKDFELIISDGIYKYRKELVIEKAKGYDFLVKHVEPFENPFPINSFCRYANTALFHAKGDLILFITDYTWLPPNCLETHVSLAKENQCVFGPHDYVGLPKLKSNFPFERADSLYSDDEGRLNQYINKLESGELNSLMWSIFDQDFQSPDELGPGDLTGADPKLRTSRGLADPFLFHAKNASCCKKSVIDVGGWDEDLDGSHGYQDSDLSFCLSSRGMTWFLEPDMKAIIVNPRYYIPRCRRIRDIASNEAIFQSKRAEGYKDRTNFLSKFY